MKYDPLEYPFPSRRMMVYADRGIVGTSQPLSSHVGLEILKKGGNAMDAAVATATSLTVLEPTFNGIGGDAFALIWDGKKLSGLNASGPSPKEISIGILQDAGYESMPKFGWAPVTVPGAPAGWAELSDEFGRLQLEEVLEPAIKYAERGYPVSPIVGRSWRDAYFTYKELEGEEYNGWFDVFTVNNRPPEIGQGWKSPAHAETLRKIARSNAGSFYRGELAEKIDEFSKEYGGYISIDDLSDFSPEWVEPISVEYRGHEVWELPPNGQGLVALLALNILKDFNFDSKEKVETYHKQIESLKLAFSDGKRFITDPDYMEIGVEELLSEDYAAERRELIGEKAIEPQFGSPQPGGTVYFAVADEEGNMVSYIQSNYLGFGSGLVIPDTGISLHNRGSLFSLDYGDANCLKPEKRTYHTIIPGFLTRKGEPVGPFGVMGGFMQPQGHLQILMNTLDFDLNPQAALDAPRWCWEGSRRVEIEHGFKDHIAKSLARRDHEIKKNLRSNRFGRGQIIWRKDGIFAGGTEPRADSSLAVW